MIDVLVKNEIFQPSTEAVIFQKEFAEMQRKEEILDAAYAGANFAALFISNPDAAKLKLEFCPSFDSDDQGGTYRSVFVNCLQCIDINGQEIDFDDDALQQALEDTIPEIYNVLAGSYESYDVVIELNRSNIQAMIDSGEVSGLQAIYGLLSEQFERLAALKSELVF